MVATIALIKTIDWEIQAPVDAGTESFAKKFVQLLQMNHTILNPTPILQQFVQEFLNNRREFMNRQQEAEILFERKY